MNQNITNITPKLLLLPVVPRYWFFIGQRIYNKLLASLTFKIIYIILQVTCYIFILYVKH